MATTKGKSEAFDAARFQLLVQGVTDYAIIMLSPDGIVSSWNSGAAKMKGYTESEILGQHFSKFFTDEDRDAGLPARALRTARETGRFETEGWRLRKDGTRFWVTAVLDAIYDEEGTFVGFAKITRDVSERRFADQKLLESERRFRLLVEGVTDYAIFMLDPTGHVVNWNPGAQRIKGYSVPEIVGQHFSRFYTEDDRRNGKPQRVLELAETTGRYEEEGWRVRKDSSFFWASVVIDAIRDDSGTLIGFAKITRDLSERREAQMELQRVQAQLAEAQKMDALGQLTGGVAHDFNNLLMIVSGNLHHLKSAAGDNPKLKRAVEAIDIATKRGATLTRQLLTFSRRQRVQPEPIKLPERLAAIHEVLHAGLGSSVQLRTSLPDNAWAITVDASEFEIALVNLVINARDAMPEGGTITISAANVSDAGSDYVALTVADSGVGIPQDVISKIFDPFFTTKPVGRGTGLGLSQVHGFAHQAGGRVEVESAMGEGTRVTLFLPRSVEPQSARASSETAAIDVRPGSVLLVEDNPDVAQATIGLLEQLGYQVRLATNAEDALTMVETEAKAFSLVLSDIVMPGKMDGIALAREIRRRHTKLPVLLATGYSDRAQSAAGDFSILRKPYQIHELSQAIATVSAASGSIH